MEVGIGIHGEPGRRRVPLAPAAEIAAAAGRADPRRPRVHRRRRRARVRQRHGRYAADRALPDVQRGRPRCSAKAGITVARSLVGNYITSLDMAGCSVTLLRARRRAAPALGRAGEDARRCGGACDRRRACRRDDDDRRDSGAVLAGGLRAGGRGQPRPPHPAGLRDRGRRPRRQPRPRHDRGRRRARRRRRATPGGAAQDHGHDAGQHGRRGERTAVRHVLPPDGGQRRATAESLDADRLRGGAARRARGRRRPRQGARPGTRRCTTRSRRPATRSTRPLAEGADLGAALARGQRRGATPAATPRPDAGPQGPGVVPRRAQRRPPGPGRDLDRPARRDGARGRSRRQVRRDRAWSSSRTAGRWPTPRWRWPREMLHGSTVRIAVAAGPRRDDVRHRRDGDRRRDRRGRRRRRGRRADGPRQRRAVGRAGPRHGRPRRPRAGRCSARRRWSRGWSWPRWRPPVAPVRPRSPPRRSAPWPRSRSTSARPRSEVSPELTPADGLASAARPEHRVRGHEDHQPHGLHARPAARLVQEARLYDARIELRNLDTGAGPAPATQPVAGGDARRALRAPGRGDGHRQPGARGRRPRPRAGRPPVRRAANTPTYPLLRRWRRRTAAAARLARDRDRAGALRPGRRRGGHRRAIRRPLDTDAEWRRIRGAVAEVRREIQRVKAVAAREVGDEDARSSTPT